MPLLMARVTSHGSAEVAFDVHDQGGGNGDTPVMVKRVVDDIDEIVRAVRFDGWQATHAGEREVKKALRQTLFRFKLHQDAELFEKAYGYIREYY